MYTAHASGLMSHVSFTEFMGLLTNLLSELNDCSYERGTPVVVYDRASFLLNLELVSR